MLYLIYQEDGDNAKAIRAAKKEEHLAYLEKHKDILVLGGATLAGDGVARTGSILLLNVASLADVERFSMNEPFRAAGLYKLVKSTRMRRDQWHPENTAKSAEGA